MLLSWSRGWTIIHVITFGTREDDIGFRNIFLLEKDHFLLYIPDMLDGRSVGRSNLRGIT